MICKKKSDLDFSVSIWSDTRMSFGCCSAVIFAILMFLHGIQKAFLLWGFPAGANPNGLGALVDLAGWVEIICALLIGFGFLTRLERAQSP